MTASSDFPPTAVLYTVGVIAFLLLISGWKARSPSIASVSVVVVVVVIYAIVGR